MTIEKAPESRQHLQSSREIQRARRKFSRVIRNLPPMGQDLISEMSSQFHELDVYNNFKSDQHNIDNFADELRQMGIDKGKIRTIMNYFNIPYESK